MRLADDDATRSLPTLRNFDAPFGATGFGPIRQGDVEAMLAVGEFSLARSSESSDKTFPIAAMSCAAARTRSNQIKGRREFVHLFIDT